MLAVARLYERILQLPLDSLDVDRAVAHWPELDQLDRQIRSSFTQPALVEKALLETHSKYVPASVLREQLNLLRKKWPSLKMRLREHLLPSSKLTEMLRLAGAPTSSDQIGISAVRLRKSFRQAYFIRRRFTILDLAERAGILDSCVSELI